MFPSMFISSLEEGPKSMAKLDGRIFHPMDTPLNTTMHSIARRYFCRGSSSFSQIGSRCTPPCKMEHSIEQKIYLTDSARITNSNSEQNTIEKNKAGAMPVLDVITLRFINVDFMIRPT